LQKYIPAQLGDDELEARVSGVMADNDFTAMKDVGAAVSVAYANVTDVIRTIIRCVLARKLR